MSNIARHYLKAVQIIIMKKNSYAEFVHASSKTMETGDKNNGKIRLKKKKRKNNNKKKGE